MIGLSFGVETAPLAAERLFDIGPLTITNSMLFGLAGALLTLIFLGLAASASQLYPRSKVAYFAESLVELILKTATDSFGNRQKALRHLPFLATLFTFILLSNLSGLLPGVESLHAEVDGQEVPLLRSFTTDLNATLAMAILAVGLVQFYAVKELGLIGHLKHYFSDKPWNPVNLFIGLNELFSEFLRIVTLSMRLFGVIYAGEVLLFTVGQLAGNFAWAATLPIMFLEIFFSLVQAYIFMMLTAAYLSMATNSDGHQTSNDIKEARTQVKLKTANY